MPSVSHSIHMAIVTMTTFSESLQIKYMIERKQSMQLSKLPEFDKIINDMRATESDIEIINRALIVLQKHNKQ